MNALIVPHAAEKLNVKMHLEHSDVPAQMDNPLMQHRALAPVLWYVLITTTVQEMLFALTEHVTVLNQMLDPIAKVCC
jgi:hypothetical protein